VKKKPQQGKAKPGKPHHGIPIEPITNGHGAVVQPQLYIALDDEDDGFNAEARNVEVLCADEPHVTLSIDGNDGEWVMVDLSPDHALRVAEQLIQAALIARATTATQAVNN
jgi:hypothetical protein